MRSRLILSMLSIAIGSGPAFAEAPKQLRLNPVIDLLEHKKPVLGLYLPSNSEYGAAPAGSTPQKYVHERAREAIDYKSADFIFEGSMEHGFDKAFPEFNAFAKALKDAGALSRTPSPRLTHPLIVKMEKITPEPGKAEAQISKQLNLGVSGVMLVEAESAKEVERGIAAMRFKSNGGTRADDVGSAPAFWGVSEQEYRQKADLWPLNPQGELINWTIVESKEGLKHVREIAAVKGVGVLWPGAGTLRGVFSTTGADGKRVVNESAWEAAIQQVLSACKEFKVPCGFPASPDNIEMRMKQGFSVFVMGWGDAGFKAVEIGRKAANRPAAGN